MTKSILIADDHEDILEILQRYVNKEGYSPILAHDGEEAILKFKECNPVLILLDVMMPIIDGFEVCRKIREASNVPIIMITAKGEDGDRIMGLDIGADDYIVKPFSLAEVMARIRAVLRRIDVLEEEMKDIIRLPGLEIDISSYEVMVKGENVNLTKRNRNSLAVGWKSWKGFSRDNLLDRVWGYDYFGDARTVDTHIKGFVRRSIFTVFKLGY